MCDSCLVYEHWLLMKVLSSNGIYSTCPRHVYWFCLKIVNVYPFEELVQINTFVFGITLVSVSFYTACEHFIHLMECRFLWMWYIMVADMRLPCKNLDFKKSYLTSRCQHFHFCPLVNNDGVFELWNGFLASVLGAAVWATGGHWWVSDQFRLLRSSFSELP